MESARLAEVLRLFINRELQPQNEDNRPLTIRDFRLGIRDLRLTEIHSWSGAELDAMDEHAARFDELDALDRVLEYPAEDADALAIPALSMHGCPSPFAWT